jgi:hypothetical protein
MFKFYIIARLAILAANCAEADGIIVPGQMALRWKQAKIALITNS